jgi:hypothetical protein
MASLKVRLDQLSRRLYFGDGPLWGGLIPTTVTDILEGRPIPAGTERYLNACFIDIAVAAILDDPDGEFSREWCEEMHIPDDADGATIIGRALDHARSLGLTRPEINELRRWIEPHPGTRLS